MKRRLLNSLAKADPVDIFGDKEELMRVMREEWVAAILRVEDLE